eukprot:scaffold24932_cov79-Isochrysis_galbana.AAC.3
MGTDAGAARPGAAAAGTRLGTAAPPGAPPVPGGGDDGRRLCPAEAEPLSRPERELGRDRPAPAGCVCPVGCSGPSSRNGAAELGRGGSPPLEPPAACEYDGIAGGSNGAPPVPGGGSPAARGEGVLLAQAVAWL